MSKTLKRADYRRLQRKEQKKEKTYTLTQEKITKMKEDVYNKAINTAYEEAVDVSFALLLAIPTNLLANCYWEKSAPKRIPEFLDDCISIYESIGAGVLTVSELIEDTEKLGKLKMNCVERLQRVREKERQNKVS